MEQGLRGWKHSVGTDLARCARGPSGGVAGAALQSWPRGVQTPDSREHQHPVLAGGDRPACAQPILPSSPAAAPVPPLIGPMYAWTREVS